VLNGDRSPPGFSSRSATSTLASAAAIRAFTTRSSSPSGPPPAGTEYSVSAIQTRWRLGRA
jgi:hypothetical protein